MKNRMSKVMTMRSLILAVSTPALFACGGKTIAPVATNLPSVPAVPTSIVETNEATATSMSEGACALWNESGAHTPTTDNTYQVVADLALGQDASGKATLMGRHVPAYLPQLLYSISREFSDAAQKEQGPAMQAELSEQQNRAERLTKERDELIENRKGQPIGSQGRKQIVAQIQAVQTELDQATDRATELRFGLMRLSRKQLDPISIEEFIAAAEKLHEQKKLADNKWNLLKGISFLSGITYPQADAIRKFSRQKLIEQRNEQFVIAVEKSLPGVFSGKTGDISGSPLVSEFLKSVGSPEVDATLLDALSPLARPVSLFPSARWADRARDVRRVMAILEQDDSKWPLQERACRYGLQTRLTAQLLKLKGFEGRPKTGAEGLLPVLAATEDATLPEMREEGIFTAPVTNDWITAQLDENTPPPPHARGAEDTNGFLDSIGYLIEITSHRSPRVWESPQAGAAGRSPKILLSMAFGLFGIVNKTLTGKLMDGGEGLEASGEAVRLPRDNSADNIARLLYITRAGLRAFDSLNNPTDFDHSVLKDSEIEKFTRPGDVHTGGALVKFKALREAAILEGLRRQRTPYGSPALLSELRAAGQDMDNDYLKSLTF